MKDYCGNRVPYLFALYHPADKARVQSILEAMDGRGLAFCGLENQDVTHAKKALAVLAFLSGQFFADESKRNAFFTVKDYGVPVIPILLDDSPIPEIMAQSMYAMNSIIASRYPTNDALAERLLTADALASPSVTAAQKKASRTTLMGLCGAAAAVLLAAVLFLMPKAQEAQVEVVEDTTVVAFGMTQKDLDEIRTVNIIGSGYEFKKTVGTPYDDNNILGRRKVYKDGALMYDPDNFSYVGSAYEPYDQVEWEHDGQPVTMTEYDLGFLSLLPNLESLSMVQVQADGFPDLSGQSHLQYLNLYECDIPDISGLAGSQVQRVDIKGSTITDYSPLSDCPRLQELYLELTRRPCDISRLAPPNLTMLEACDLFNVIPEMDFSYMRDHSQLQHLHFTGKGLKNLDAISDMPQLKYLHIENATLQNGLAGISKLTTLEHLWTDQRNRRSNDFTLSEADIQEIAACTALETISLYENVPSVNFLNSLPNLNYIQICSAQHADLAFLNRIRKPQIEFLNIISGDITVSEPLQPHSIDQVWLQFNGRNSEDADLALERSFGDALQALTIRELYLNDFYNVVDSALPNVTEVLRFSHSSLKDLTTLTAPVKTLELDNMDLVALNGLPQHLENLRIISCRDLENWSALENAQIDHLFLSGMRNLPDFGNLNITQSLTLENIPVLFKLDSISPLLEKTPGLSLSFPGDSNLKDVSLLEAYRGNTLGMPPHLDREGRQLVASGNFTESAVVYPEHWISDDEMMIQLESLEDLDIMTEDELALVEQIAIAGDTLYDPNNGYAYGSGPVWIGTYDSSEPRMAGRGFIEDMHFFDKLPNLRRLTLVGQPLKNLEGIQILDNLETMSLSDCTMLADISPAFTLSRLTSIDVGYSQISSIEGIQLLPRIDQLNIRNTKVSDLSPLEFCNFGDYIQLDISFTNVKDLTPLKNIRNYSNLSLTGTKATAEDFRALFEQVEGITASSLNLYDCNLDQETFDLIMEKTTGLFSISLEGNPGIHDLSALMNQSDLRYVYLSGNMSAARDALLERNPSFEIDIW